MSEATLEIKSNGVEPVLYMALELSERSWKVLFGTPEGKRRERNVPAREVGLLFEELAAARRRLGLPCGVRVVSCYEAGREGFWLHRALEAQGVESLVVDSASIEVPRRKRRAKTDRLDVRKLLGLLVRHLAGERRMWSVLRVPDRRAEDIRQLSRSIGRLKTERNRHVTRIKALLATQGLTLKRVGGADWEQRLEALREWDGAPLGRFLHEDLALEGERLALVDEQLAKLKAARAELVAAAEDPIAVAAGRLALLGGVAAESSFVFAAELLGWRRFANRREVAGAAGLTGTPWASGGEARDQGISKSGNPRIRAMLVEIAWCWLRYQPQSTLSLWFRERFAQAGGRARRSGIVALARKLLVALWRYLEAGVVPEGARLKAAA